MSLLNAFCNFTADAVNAPAAKVLNKASFGVRTDGSICTKAASFTPTLAVAKLKAFAVLATYKGASKGSVKKPLIAPKLAINPPDSNIALSLALFCNISNT